MGGLSGRAAAAAAARLRRLPVRVRITLVSAAAMAVVFGLLALFLYLHFRSSLDASIDGGLYGRAAELSALSRRLDRPISRVPAQPRGDADYGFAQLLDARGAIIDASAGLRSVPLLAPPKIAAARRHPLLVDRTEADRLYAVAAPGRKVVVVGVSLADREAAMETLDAALALGMPLALAVASLITYLMTGRLLQPVERMREQAALISAEDLDGRLPLPESRDEIQRLGRTLNDMLDRLRSGVERERRFVSDASHELRTPLAIVKAELEVALRTNGTPQEWHDAVSSAVEETDRVISLAEDLLVLARAQAGALPVDVTTLAVNRILADAAMRFGDAAARSGRSIKVDPGAGGAVNGDPARVRQALDNLIDNALRHGAGTVTLHASAWDGWVQLHVLDEGRGFPEEFLPQAFQRFSRPDAARTRGGAGLGLSIVETIAEAHGGRAGARNRPAGGADVWVALPAAPRRPVIRVAGGESPVRAGDAPAAGAV